MANEGLLSGGAGRFADLKRRLLFLLGALIVYRIGAHIPVPGIDPAQLAELFKAQRGGILDMFNMFSGGALSRFTIFALGIMPYISSSIIMQLMSVVSPKLEALKKEGESGRRKITQYTRYGTLALATVQALGIAIALEGQSGLVIDPGTAVPLHHGGDAGDRDHVPDVAGRADHRARHRQRHLADYFRRHCGRACRGPSAAPWSWCAPVRSRSRWCCCCLPARCW